MVDQPVLEKIGHVLNRALAVPLVTVQEVLYLRDHLLVLFPVRLEIGVSVLLHQFLLALEMVLRVIHQLLQGLALEGFVGRIENGGLQVVDQVHQLLVILVDGRDADAETVVPGHEMLARHAVVHEGQDDEYGDHDPGNGVVQAEHEANADHDEGQHNEKGQTETLQGVFHCGFSRNVDRAR